MSDNSEVYKLYGDIINMNHHVSLKRPKMSLNNRAAQFAPFSALTGYESAIMETARLTDEKIELDENMKEKLNSFLVQIHNLEDENPLIKVKYFLADAWKSGGEYITYTGEVKYVDDITQKIVFIDGLEIGFNNILKISIVN